MEIRIAGKEVIKPSSLPIKTFNLSSLDQQLYGCAYVKLFFFYPNSSGSFSENKVSGKLQCLKSSLSEVLTHYYPFSGKTKDIYSVYVGEDDGVEFLEARVNGTLSEYLAKPDVDMIISQLVQDDHWESWERPLLAIQASIFTCGGLSIGMSFSHRVADIATVACFLNAWANTASGKLDKVVRADLSGSLTFPPSDQFWGMEVLRDRMPILLTVRPDIITRRFVFSASHIISLQEKAAKQGIHSPSRVQTVTAFLWRIGLKMSILKAGGSQMPSTLVMPISLRRILPPPISDQSFGNLIEVVTVHNHIGDLEISILIKLIKEKIDELRNTYQEKVLRGETCFARSLGVTPESMLLAFNRDIPNNFSTTCWCRSPLYDADFGWGKPTWVANGFRGPNWMVLNDTSDGTGIEAWLSFCKEDMNVFASDEELLEYATPDPSVL